MPIGKFSVLSHSTNTRGASIYTDAGFVNVRSPALAELLVGQIVTVEYSEMGTRTIPGQPVLDDNGKPVIVNGKPLTQGERTVPTLIGARLVDFEEDSETKQLLAKAQKMGLKPTPAYTRPGRTTVTNPVAAAAAIQ